MAEENTCSDQDIRLRLYADTRSDLLKRQLSNSENADRAILSVSTAALGFSLAFLNDIVSLQGAMLFYLPYVSWALFVLAIVVTLSSFFTSQKAIDEQLEIAHKYYIDRDDGAVMQRSKYAAATDTLNKSGAILLVAGLGVTCMFVGFNLWKGKPVSDKKISEGASVPCIQRTSQGGELLRRGASIPTLQTVPTNPQSGAPVPSLQKVPSPPTPVPAASPKEK